MNNQDLYDLDLHHEGQGGTLDERSHSFIEDIMEGIDDPNNDPLLAINSHDKKMLAG